jgi:hypothetical protein
MFVYIVYSITIECFIKCAIFENAINTLMVTESLYDNNLLCSINTNYLLIGVIIDEKIVKIGLTTLFKQTNPTH